MNPEAYKMFSVKDNVIIITGGAGFLGMQYANALKSVGAKVVSWDIPVVDITNKKDVKKATNDIIRNFGRIDVLINNAAMNPIVGSEEAKKMFAPYEKYPLTLFKKEIEVDLIGMHFCIQAVAPSMMKQKSGVIVNVTSEYANIAADNRIYEDGKFKSVAYITAKSGVLGLTRAWASYFGRYGIRVNAFTPGGMPHPGTPKKFWKKYSNLNMLGRPAKIDEYNGVILFLCSDASSFMTGAQLIVDGGKSAW